MPLRIYSDCLYVVDLRRPIIRPGKSPVMKHGGSQTRAYGHGDIPVGAGFQTRFVRLDRVSAGPAILSARPVFIP